MVCICRLVHVYIYTYIYLFLNIFVYLYCICSGKTWTLLIHTPLTGRWPSSHQHPASPLTLPPANTCNDSGRTSMNLICRTNASRVVLVLEGEWDSKPRNVKHTPKVLIIYIGVELHLKGGVARSNHTRRDTIEINVPWCTCNLMSFCQVSHIYAFSCLFPWLLDAWHSTSRLKGCCLECIKSPTSVIPRLLASVKVQVFFLFVFVGHFPVIHAMIRIFITIFAQV